MTDVRVGGRVWTLTTYTDPHPGRDNTDRVVTECGMCVDGVFTGPSTTHWDNGRGDRTWCFWCNGSNKRLRQVGDLRRAALTEAWWREHGDTIRAESAAKRAAIADGCPSNRRTVTVQPGDHDRR
ncbi:hypothetical protein ACQ856_18085 [Mycolicibacterium psychrotolerans]|uniref:hypothetical protein n=1 Tax=Mycolicibacterium psychrotolerans TaxID=216929 RepID=UPI003D67A224